MSSRLIPAQNRAHSLDLWRNFLEHFEPGKELVVTVEEFVEERSPAQRASLFGVAYKALMPQIGLRGAKEKEDLHRFFCCEYWGTKISALGERIPLRTTTTDEQGKRDVISMREQLDFYVFIQQRAATMGYDVPNPDKLWRIRAERDAQFDAMTAVEGQR